MVFDVTTTFNQDILNTTSDTLIVRVPGLAEFQDPNFLLIGTPNDHSGEGGNDPCRSNIPTSQHFLTHFGSSELRGALNNIGSDFEQIYPGYRLRLNDMSLENGGLLDIYNNWSSGHAEHRIGKQADLDPTVLNDIGECVNNQVIINNMDRIVRRRTNGLLLTHDNDDGTVNHYHLRVN